jgi:threonine dehydrogenase-like Zn-dependent dehydrogenase
MNTTKQNEILATLEQADRTDLVRTAQSIIDRFHTANIELVSALTSLRRDVDATIESVGHGLHTTRERTMVRDAGQIVVLGATRDLISNEAIRFVHAVRVDLGVEISAVSLLAPGRD